MRLLKQSSTAQPLVFLMVQSSDHVTGLTGASPTVTLRKSNASAAGSFGSPSGTVRELGSGWYQVDGNATDTGTLGPLILHATAGSGDPTDLQFEVVAFDPQSATNLGLSALPTATAGANTGLAVVGTQIPNATAAAAGGLMVTGASNTGTTTFAGGISANAFSMTSLNNTGNSTFGGNVSFQSALSVATNVTFGGFIVPSGTVLGGSVSVTGPATFAGGMVFSSSANGSAVIDVLAFGTNSHAIRTAGSGSGHGLMLQPGTGGNGLYIGSGDVTPSLNVEDASTFGGGLYFGDTATFTGGIVANALSMTSLRNSGATTFVGNTTYAGTLGVAGLTTLTGLTAGALTLSSVNNTGASTFIGAITASSASNSWSGTLARVTLVDTSTDVTTKTGYILAASGLDSINITPPTSAIGSWNFREKMIMAFRRFFGKAVMNSTQLKTYAADGTTVLSTQSVSVSGSTQTQGEGA